MINLKVSELMNYIKGLTSKDYVLSRLVVEGEISNMNFHTNGTAYFTIKDEFSNLSCVFHNFSQKENIREFKNGDLVGVTGKVSLYEKDGRLSMLVEDVDSLGIGKLFEKYIVLKKELEDKGYFDKKYKKEIPRFPKKVGIITSQTGAAIKDIVSVAKRRSQYSSLYLYSAVVQGSYAEQSLIKGLEYFENTDMDVVIIGRGGGSYEDLDAFNSKELALKIFNFPIPIVSAVGHEIDYVISDFIADIRAATPSVAAEIVIPDFVAYLDTVDGKIERAKLLVNRITEDQYMKLFNYKKRIRLFSIDNLIDNKLSGYIEKISYGRKSIINKLNVYEERLNSLYKLIDSKIIINKADKLQLYADNKIKEMDNLLYKYINNREKELLNIKSRIDNLDIKGMLQKGYSIVTTENGKIIKSIDDIELNENLTIILYDGELETKVYRKEGLK